MGKKLFEKLGSLNTNTHKISVMLQQHTWKVMRCRQETTELLNQGAVPVQFKPPNYIYKWQTTEAAQAN